MSKLKRIIVNIRFEQPFKTVPKVTIIRPRPSSVGVISCEGFVAVLMLHPRKTFEVNIDYMADMKEAVATVCIQFCPCCLEPLTQWLTIMTAGFTPQGKIGPAMPLGLCPLCGVAFVARKTMQEFKQGQTRRIIRPGGLH